MPTTIKEKDYVVLYQELSVGGFTCVCSNVKLAYVQLEKFFAEERANLSSYVYINRILRKNTELVLTRSDQVRVSLLLVPYITKK